jgi:DNA primase
MGCGYSSFGSNSADKADWLPLKGRDVTIWPDRDPPGEKYAANGVRLAWQAGVTRVRVVDWCDTPDELKATLSVGMDIADLPGAGWTVEHIAAMVDGAQEQRAKKISPGENL